MLVRNYNHQYHQYKALSRRVPNSPSLQSPPEPKLAFFFTISIGDYPKIRIRIPKSLFNVMKKKKSEKLKSTFPKKVGGILSSVFGNKKPPVIKCSSEEIGGSGHRKNEIEKQKYKKHQPLKKCVKNDDGILLIVKQRCYRRRLGKIPSKILMARLQRAKESGEKRGKRIKAKKRQSSGEETGEEEEGEVELCKKRILLGGKCKPLNSSGALHYDDEGVLLPEFYGE